MIEPARGKVQGGAQIFRFEIGHLVEDLFGRQAGGEEVQDVSHPNPHAANARTTATLLRIDGDPIHQLCHD